MANKRQRKKTNGNIRLSDKDKKEYNRLKNNAKAKMKRIQNKVGKEVIIKTTNKQGEQMVTSMLTKNLIEIPKLKEFTDRKQFNKWKESVKDFTKRSSRTYKFVKNDYGVAISEKLLKESVKKTKRAQDLADREISKYVNLPTFSDGKKQVETVGQNIAKMGRNNPTGIIRPSDFNFAGFRNKYDAIDKIEGIERKADEKYYDARMEKMRDNFAEILRLTFHSDADEIANTIKEIPPDIFYEMYLMFEEFDFDLYDSEGQFGEESDLGALKSYLDAYKHGLVSFDMKPFPNG